MWYSSPSPIYVLVLCTNHHHPLPPSLPARFQSVGVEFEAHSVVTCAALYKAFTFCKQEMKRYLAQLEKGQVGAGWGWKRRHETG